MNKSKYLSIKDGEAVTVKFLDVEPCKVQGKGKIYDGIRYKFEHNGKVLLFERTNLQLAREMEKIESGELIKIIREGEYNKTKYKVEKVIG